MSLDELRASLDSIVVRCEEGDRGSDWLPVIARLAREALGRVAAAEAERDALRAALERILDAGTTRTSRPAPVNPPIVTTSYTTAALIARAALAASASGVAEEDA